ncbi:MAG: hypothetical protein F6K36_26900 [Symploca sp. SIO3C6]|nr:hypothetical protein [Symploca sp. SIO3C6]
MGRGGDGEMIFELSSNSRKYNLDARKLNLSRRLTVVRLNHAPLQVF